GAAGRGARPRARRGPVRGRRASSHDPRPREGQAAQTRDPERRGAVDRGRLDQLIASRCSRSRRPTAPSHRTGPRRARNRVDRPARAARSPERRRAVVGTLPAPSCNCEGDGTAPMADYEQTHVVPTEGLPAWAGPDSSVPPAANLDPGLDVMVIETRTDWAHIRCSNGWEAWV